MGRKEVVIVADLSNISVVNLHIAFPQAAHPAAATSTPRLSAPDTDFPSTLKRYS